jgi:predicted DNA-binding transcriptional regulator YafY
VIYAWIDDDRVEIDRQPMSDPLARPARLSPLTARALLLALDLIGEAFAGEGLPTLASVRGKVEALVAGLPKPGTVDLVDLAHADEEAIRAINEGLRHRRLVSLTYYTSVRGELKERLVEPYLLFHSGSAWYLEAYCLAAEGERTFRLDRVQRAAVIDRTFVPRAALGTGLRPEELLDVESRAAWAVVRFPAERRALLEEQGLFVEPEQDGSVRARIPYLDERWLVREVLRYAGEAVLEEPAHLRADIARLAATLRRSYARTPSTD